MRRTFFSLLVLLSSFLVAFSSDNINKDVSTVIDASNAMVRMSVEIKASISSNQYQLSLPNSWADNLAYLSVNINGKAVTARKDRYNNMTVFSLPVKESTFTIKVSTVFTSLLEMYPAQIAQGENQLVRFEGSHYFFSPYMTESQKLVVKLPSTSVESFSKLSPHAVRGSSIHFGPYKDIQAFQTSPLQVHYTNNFPFAKFSSMVREVEVSHWGSISVEEIYELKHAGAELKGGFSRFDYQLRRGQQGSSFRSLTAQLPAQASNIYYRDQIGNISTSEIKTTRNGNLDLEIQTRFPLFGGWQTQFYIGYSIPTELALFLSEGDQYVLKVDFNTPFNDVWVEDMEMKVILPEGCYDIEVSNPYEAEQARSIRYSFLDSSLNGGRPVVVLRAKNLVEEHSKKVVVTYKFNKSRMIVEPLMLVVTFFGLFIVCSLLARTSAITSKKSANVETASS